MLGSEVIGGGLEEVFHWPVSRVSTDAATERRRNSFSFTHRLNFMQLRGGSLTNLSTALPPFLHVRHPSQFYLSVLCAIGSNVQSRQVIHRRITLKSILYVHHIFLSRWSLIIPGLCRKDSMFEDCCEYGIKILPGLNVQSEGLLNWCVRMMPQGALRWRARTEQRIISVRVGLCW